jgi:hypothetical protein
MCRSADGRGKENVESEKCLYLASVYEDSIVHCTISLISGQGDRERKVMGTVLYYLKYDIDMSQIPRQNHLQLSLYTLKHEGRKIKHVLSGGGFQWKRGEHKERGIELECGGYVLYQCMKIKQ